MTKLDSMELISQAILDMRLSEQEFHLAVIYAVQDGYNNVQIAQMAGTTESSIRRLRRKLGC